MARPSWVWGMVGAALLPLGCGLGRRAHPPGEGGAGGARAPRPSRSAAHVHAPIPRRPALPPLADGETYRYAGSDSPQRMARQAAGAAGLLDVDLSDGWAPFILQDSGGAAGDAPKPNPYRQTFIGLASDRLTVDGQPAPGGEHNFLEVFGIPPTLSVLAARIEEDLQPARQSCYDGLDLTPLRRFTGNIGYADRDRAKKDLLEAIRDAEWVRKEIAAARGEGPIDAAALQALREDPKRRGRVDRYLRGQERLQAVRAAQALLVCDGLLSTSARTRFTDGMYDLTTHEALADWEKKNDIFGWGFLGGETLASLPRAPLELHFETFKRILAERVADAAGIVEDGSAAKRAKKGNVPTYLDAAGVEHPVPNLIADHVAALLAALHVSSPEEMVSFLRAHGSAGLAGLRVALAGPALPPYYGGGAPGVGEMQLAVEIDRGDIWYDVPFDSRGRPIVQPRDHYPHLTVFALWNGQKIPLCWWRTTIGSWRSEVHADGRIYMKYKNSDVGKRVWKNIVAGPVWIPPDGTPARDLLTRKVLDRNVGPVTVVNTDVMGPGFQSAYGLVMAIHVDPQRGGFDNQIRTHGSVDYTSIARRFSHGCHRLVNDRAVRMFDFVLRRRPFRRIGNTPLRMRRQFKVDGHDYAYRLDTRGYYYELAQPIPVEVTEGRIMGQLKRPITAFVHKPGVDYSTPSSGDAATSISAPLGGAEAAGGEPAAAVTPDSAPELGP